MPFSRTAIIGIILGLLLLAAAGYLLMGQNSLTSAVTIEDAPTSEAEQRFLSLTARIDPVELDTSILSDKRFVLLQDIRTDIIPESYGRVDPFAPLGGAP